jgi:Ala-tRNA(Pro) deacylase
MVALPAPARLDLDAISRATGHKNLRLGLEAEFCKLFKDCDPGAMPPFGSLYDMPLYLDACLAASPEIAFQAGNHHELVVMKYAEYARLAHPMVGRSCLHHVRQKMAS